MRTIKAFTLLASVVVGAFAASAQADSFDDAVNLYLKGFDHCSSAKDALGRNDLKSARSQFSQYEAILKQASALDASINSSSKRGMDSNLKFCKRVGTDIEIATGMPTLEKALGACEQAFASLKDGKVEPARGQHQQFVALRDEALKTAPSLNNVFSVRSEIRRCEKLDSKIASFGQKQAAQTEALQSAQEASELFQGSCESALAELNSATGAAAVQAGRKSQAKVQAHQKAAADDYAALKAAAKGTEIAEKATIEGRIAKGNQCLTQLASALATRERSLKTAQDDLARQSARLVQANQSCSGITAVSTSGATQAQYDQARASFESARKTRDEARAALAKNPLYGSEGGPDVGAQMAALDGCLDKSRKHLSALLGAVSAATAAAAKPAPVVKAEPAPAVAAKVETVTPVVTAPAPAAAAVAVAKPASPAASAGIPALSVTGNLTITDILPDFAVLYWQDGSSAAAEVDVAVHPTGFDQTVYFLRPGGSLVLRSEDFAAHRISAVNSATGSSQMLAQIRSRQSRTVKTGWADNSISTLGSDQSRVVQSYVVSVNSASTTLLKFGNNKSVAIDLKNPKNGRKGYLVMPDYDPVAFEIAQGEEKKIPVTRSGAVVGTLTLKGN